MSDKGFANPIIDVNSIDIAGRSAADIRIETERERAARYRDYFLTSDNEKIKKILQLDLRKYVDDADISRMRMVTLDYFVPAFLNRLCLVYDQPPSIIAGKSDNEKLINLMKDVGINKAFTDILYRMKLHNTALPIVKFNKTADKVFIDTTLNEANTIVYPYSDYIFDFSAIAIRWYDSDGKEMFTIWDKTNKEHYYLDEKPRYNSGEMRFMNEIQHRKTIGDNKDYKAPPYWPFIIYREKVNSRSFWGNGMDSIIELVRLLNILLTIASDDTVQESIRILILNFNPTGTEGEKGQLKSGLRHPFFAEGGLGTTDPSGEILKAELFNEDILKLVESIADMIANLHSIPNILKSEITSQISGIALKIKNEPLVQKWRKDIETVRESDIALVRAVIDVNNYYNDGNKIPDSVKEQIEIEYMQPQFIYDEKEEYDLERQKWEDGVSSPIKWLMNKHNITREEAIKMAKENQDELNLVNEFEPITIPRNNPEDIINGK